MEESIVQSHVARAVTCMKKPGFLLALGLINLILLLATRCGMAKMHAIARGFGENRQGMMQWYMMKGWRDGRFGGNQGEQRGSRGGNRMQGKSTNISDDAQGAQEQWQNRPIAEKIPDATAPVGQPTPQPSATTGGVQ